MARALPNILITGTPCTGKTSTCEALAATTGLTHINIGQLVKDLSLHDGWDDEYGCHIMNEDKVLDELEPMMAEGGKIVDYHGCDFFPERWFDLVVVLRTDNTVLYDRLAKRGYTGKKLSDNLESEIMQVIRDEAMESYRPEIVKELESNTVQDMDSNVVLISEWIEELKQ